MDGIHEVPGKWITLAQAGKILGCSRQNAHLMAKAGKFESLHTIAPGTIFVVAEDEVLSMPVKNWWKKILDGKEACALAVWKADGKAHIEFMTAVEPSDEYVQALIAAASAKDLPGMSPSNWPLLIEACQNKLSKLQEPLDL